MSDSINVIRPRGSATGPGWQYKLERADVSTDWVDWDEELEFAVDPDGSGDPLHTEETYWLYGRHPDLPDDEPGSVARPMAVSLQITQTGRVVSTANDGTLIPEAGDLMEQFNRACAPDQNVILRMLLNSMDEASQALLCEKIAVCGITNPNANPVFLGGTDYIEVDDVTESDEAYVLRFDVNTCADFTGWCADTTHPDQAPSIDIKRDGAVVATITATLQRNEVRDYLIAQGLIPQGSTFATYGWTFDKPPTDADGQNHTYRAFGAGSTTEATSDTGAQNAINCGNSGVSIARIKDLLVLALEQATPLDGQYRIVKQDNSTSLLITDSTTYLKLQQRYSDNTWYTVTEGIWYWETTLPGAIVSDGTFFADPSESGSGTVSVYLLNGLVIAAPITTSATGVTPTNAFRIVKNDGSTTLATNEGTDLQPQIQRQYSDNSWLDDAISAIWQATNNLPAGIGINSATGKLSVPENTITENLSLTIYATVVAGGTTIPLSVPATVINMGATGPAFSYGTHYQSSSPSVPVNTLQWIQYRYVAAYWGSGTNKDAIEVQILDTYANGFTTPGGPYGNGVVKYYVTGNSPDSGVGNALYRRYDGLRAFVNEQGLGIRNQPITISVEIGHASGETLLTKTFNIGAHSTTTPASGYTNLFLDPTYGNMPSTGDIQAYVGVTNTGSAFTGWDNGAVRYFAYDADTLTCAQAQAQFSSLTPDQKLIQTTTAAPTKPTGYSNWAARSC